MKGKPNRFLTLGLLACCGALLISPVAAQSPDDVPQVSILEVMEQVITPMTNTLWGAYEPPTDEEWILLENAAVGVIASGAAINLGGTGPQDNEWVKEPAWRAFNQVMINAGVDALAAVRAKDLDALLKAGEVLYPPCEGCHLQFNPGVINQ